MAHESVRLFPLASSPSELALRLGIPRRTVYEWVRNGLKIYRVGTRRKILTVDCVEYIRANIETVELKT